MPTEIYKSTEIDPKPKKIVETSPNAESEVNCTFGTISTKFIDKISKKAAVPKTAKKNRLSLKKSSD